MIFLLSRRTLKIREPEHLAVSMRARHHPEPHSVLQDLGNQYEHADHTDYFAMSNKLSKSDWVHCFLLTGIYRVW